MRNKIVEIANDCGMTGLKRTAFFVIAPFVALVSFAAGFVKGVMNVSKKSD